MVDQIIELVGDLGKATQKGVAVNESKVELWGLQSTLDGGKAGSRAVSALGFLEAFWLTSSGQGSRDAQSDAGAYTSREGLSTA